MRISSKFPGFSVKSQQSGLSIWTPHHILVQKFHIDNAFHIQLQDIAKVARESKKQEASLPRPPFPIPMSGSMDKIFDTLFLEFLRPVLLNQYHWILAMVLHSIFPGIYSIER